MSCNADKARVFLALALLWLLGLYLRLPILVIPPLAPFINADLGLSQTLLGSLTTLPILMLSLGALLGSLAILRLGARNSLALALTLVALTSAIRGMTDSLALLLILTSLMGLSIAIMQPSLPALLPRWLDDRKLALGTAVYMNGMLMGEFLGAGVTLPLLMPLMEGSWRATLIAWSLPALLIVLATFLPRQREDTSSHDTLEETGWIPNWKDPFLWRIGLLLASSASLFFGTNAYLGSLLEERAELNKLEAAFFWFNVAQVAASLLMLVMINHWVARRAPLVVSTGLSLVGMLGLLLTSGWLSIAFAFFLSFWAGVLLILLVALPPQLLSGKQAGRLAAGAFTLAYSLSFFVPLLGGSLADWTGQPSHALWLLFAVSCPALWLAWRFPLAH
ncbi:MFS transporter [Marinospirillum sp.]|uniref:MFS transporter n=1 Tax=Marinospirillum sp. TaxID=2183934 RepID=UPI00286FEF84|nr:MFS transporter [Marinospirillum sp.]MDR9469287.1 MFS transporter [Marinospirillum sp.]